MEKRNLKYGNGLIDLLPEVQQILGGPVKVYERKLMLSLLEEAGYHLAAEVRSRIHQHLPQPHLERW